MTSKGTTRLLCLLILAVLLLSACGQAPEQPVAEPSPAVETPTPTPEPTPDPAPEPTPTPTPSLPDVDIHSWELLLANSYNSIAWYEPKEVAYYESQGMDARIFEATQKMMGDAREAGLPLYIAVGMRNLEYTLNTTLNRYGLAENAREAAQEALPLGSSEHQMGLGIDFTDDISYIAAYYEFEDSDAQQSETFQWLMAHCQEYGFIFRYPIDKAEWYGVSCPHWHFRYVGVEAATYIMENGLCLEEFLNLYEPGFAFLPEHGRFN